MRYCVTSGRLRIRVITGIVGFILAVLSPVYTICADAVAQSSFYTGDEYHAGVDFEDMEIQWIDEEATDRYLEDCRALLASGTDEDIVNMYDTLVTLCDYVATQYQLNGIRYDCDVNNEEYASLDLEMSEYSNELFDKILMLIRDALKSPHADALKAHIDDEELVGDFLDYQDMTDEQKELDKELDRLLQEYDREYLIDPSVTIDGETWTFDKLSRSADITEGEFDDIVYALYGEYNSRLAPIYVDLVRNRNRDAKIEGYDNYADYAYETIYARDYTTSDIQTVYDNVAKYIVPLYNELSNDSEYNFKLSRLDLPSEERLNRVAPVIPKIHPDLCESWEYMTEHKLYNIDSSDAKRETGHTINLYSYQSPFIFDKPYGSWMDIETVIHEFGHYNQSYHSQEHIITYVHNVDVMEIDSQGLEVLCLEYADDIYGDGCAAAVRDQVLMNLLDAIIDGCIYDEFQYRAYTYNGELTVDVLNDIFAEVRGRYKLDGDADYMNIAWVEIPHTYEQPMYYISYATSALAALDILAMSVEDRQAAIDCYMHITTYNGELGFRETIDDVGLPDIFEDGVIEDISIAVSEYAGGSISDIARVFKDPVFIISVFVILIVLVIIIIIRMRARKGIVL